jgi:hypothetical protein
LSFLILRQNRVQLVFGLLLVLLLTGTGCAHLFSWTTSPPKAVVKGDFFLTNNAGNVLTSGVLQVKVMRFADDYVATISQAADDFGARVGTSEGRLASLKWKLGQATSAYTDASGVNPVINALDLLVLVSVSRMVVEDYGMSRFGTNVLPLLQVQRQLESNAWDVASGMMSAAQKQEFRNMILEWRRQHPDQRYVGAVRFVEFAGALGERPTAATTTPNSIFSLLFIDPFAGLDPTTAAIEEAQQFGERLMYYAQRMPTLIAWQSELVALDLASQPESRQILTNAQQLATAADSFAKTTAQLPQLINDQREAAINQIFDRLFSEQTNTSALLNESRATLVAGDEAARSINLAIKSLDDFVRYVSAPGTNSAPAATNSHPFNVLDYGVAAGQIGAAARDLNAALASLNQSSLLLSNLSQTTTAGADRLVSKVFWRGLLLIVLFLSGAVLAALLVRRLTK